MFSPASLKDKCIQGRIPDRSRHYVLGDIHGRAKLLEQVLDFIRIDHQKAQSKGAPPGKSMLICLGDYVDRGENSAGVIDLLSDFSAEFDCVFLKGNHEEMMLDFVDGLSDGVRWLTNGGIETLEGYAISPKVIKALINSDITKAARTAMKLMIPASHLEFLRSLVTHYQSGDYYFAHAGINPDLTLAQQRPEDLLWVRKPFLASENTFEKIIVHGHTPTKNARPSFGPQRIGIDTKAYASNRLTCLILEGDQRTYMQTD